MPDKIKLLLQPITFKVACAFVKEHHSHHKAPQGHKFSIGVNNGEKLVGVIMVGRPVARLLDNGYTAEAIRCCTDGTKHAASKLYAAAWRCSRAMGYLQLITYTLAEESGTSVKAAGWKVIGQTTGGKWNRKKRPRKDDHPTGPKTKWQIT